jgi:hypothetical protein
MGMGWKQEKGAKQCVDSLYKQVFEFLKNHHGNIIYKKFIKFFK